MSKDAGDFMTFVLSGYRILETIFSCFDTQNSFQNMHFTKRLPMLTNMFLSFYCGEICHSPLVGMKVNLGALDWGPPMSPVNFKK